MTENAAHLFYQQSPIGWHRRPTPHYHKAAMGNLLKTNAVQKHGAEATWKLSRWVAVENEISTQADIFSTVQRENCKSTFEFFLSSFVE
ncbi:MAG: hypothetical protein MUC59_01045 [Saprospiraceae bacterium]|nr:hypothetical protein [Saprospiraceae bacterium]